MESTNFINSFTLLKGFRPIWPFKQLLCILSFTYNVKVMNIVQYYFLLFFTCFKTTAKNGCLLLLSSGHDFQNTFPILHRRDCEKRRKVFCQEQDADIILLIDARSANVFVLQIR